MFTNKSFKSLKLHTFHFPLKPNCRERLFCVNSQSNKAFYCLIWSYFLLLLEVGEGNLPTKKKWLLSYYLRNPLPFTSLSQWFGAFENKGPKPWDYWKLLYIMCMLLLLLSRFSCVWLWYWSGLPFPSPTHESEKSRWSCSVVPDS